MTFLEFLSRVIDAYPGGSLAAFLALVGFGAVAVCEFKGVKLVVVEVHKPTTLPASKVSSPTVKHEPKPAPGPVEDVANR